MSAVVFLLLAVTMSLGGAIVLWLRHRRPTSFDSGIDAFRREMRALAPPGDGDGGGPPPRRRGPRS